MASIGNTIRQRGSKVTERQHEIMLSFMENHPELSGKLSANFSRVDGERLWDQLVMELNFDGSGPAKNVAKWKKSFADWKSTTKAKAARIKLKPTGGGPKKEELTPQECRLIVVMGELAIEGDLTQECPGFQTLNTAATVNVPINKVMAQPISNNTYQSSSSNQVNTQKTAKPTTYNVSMNDGLAILELVSDDEEQENEGQKVCDGETNETVISRTYVGPLTELGNRSPKSNNCEPTSARKTWKDIDISPSQSSTSKRKTMKSEQPAEIVTKKLKEMEDEKNKIKVREIEALERIATAEEKKAEAQTKLAIATTANTAILGEILQKLLMQQQTTSVPQKNIPK